MTTPTPPESPVTVAELSEVFQLGGTLARIETTLGHVAATGEKTNTAVGGMQEALGIVQVTLGQHSTILANVVPRVDKLEAAPSPDHVTRAEHEELKAEVKAGRLSWPKVAVLITALGGIIALVGALDSWTPAT